MCILLVEDEPLIREIMVECLQEAGLDVMDAATGDEAIELIRTRPRRFSILVTDVHMPGRSDGSTVARCIRSHRPQIPVVIASAQPEIFQARWTADLGYVLLPKPYRPSDLVQLVHELVP